MPRSSISPNKSPWYKDIQRLKELEKEREGLRQLVGARMDRVYAFIVAYKLKHDGNSPSQGDIAEGCGLPNRAEAGDNVKRLVKQGRLEWDGRYRQVQVVGGSWTIPGAQNIIKGLK
jgi:SOS-response transcriptional repressor LexA